MLQMTSKALSVTITALLLSACSAAKTPAPHMASHNSSTQETLIKTSKPGAAVQFAHDFNGVLKAGENRDVNIILTEGYSSGQLTLEIIDNPNLAVSYDKASMQFSMNGDKSHQVSLNVKALADGLHYLNITAIADYDFGQTARQNFAIAVNTGNAVEKSQTLGKTPQLSQKSTGGVVVMDAEEEIIQK